jgi:hypothetical protein
MDTTTPTEAESFQIFLSREIANGGRHKSPEELVDDWRRQQRELHESVAGVQEALDEIDRGVPGRPLREIAHEIRAKHGWQNPS